MISFIRSTVSLGELLDKLSLIRGPSSGLGKRQTQVKLNVRGKLLCKCT